MCGLVLAGTVALAQEVAPLSATSPFWVGHLRPEGLELEPGESGWTVRVGLAYGNTFSFSPEVLRFHDEAGRRGDVLEAGELVEARNRWPNAGLYAIDAEVLRMDLSLSFAGDRWFGGGRVDSWRIGGTDLDRWPAEVHDAWGLADQGRPLFPDGQTVLAVLPAGSTGWIALDADGARLVDAAAWGGRFWDSGSGIRHRVWLAVSRPISNDLVPDSDWNVGIRWALSKGWPRAGCHGGAGWTLQGGRAGEVGPAAETWHGWLGADVRLGKGWSGLLTARVDQSVFADVARAKPGRTTGAFAFGLGVPLHAGWRLRVSLGEDFPGMGIPPDFSIQTALLWRPGEGPR